MFHRFFDPLDYLEQGLQLRVIVRNDRIMVLGMGSLNPHMRLWVQHILERYESVLRIQVENDRTSVFTLIAQGKMQAGPQERIF